MKKTMSPLLNALLLLVMCMPALAKQQEVKKQIYQISYELVIAADGSIESLAIRNPKVGEVLSQNLEKQIRSWAYTPAHMDGKPARTETNLWLTVKATPNADGNFEIHIDDAGTGASVGPGGLTPPVYPRDALIFGYEAVLRLIVSYDADGRVTEVSRPGKKTKDMSLFDKASFAAAKTWRFSPEKINGIGIPGQMIVPIQFCLAPGNCQSLLKGSAEKEKLAREVAQQSIPMGSQVTFRRQLN